MAAEYKTTLPEERALVAEIEKTWQQLQSRGAQRQGVRARLLRRKRPAR